MIRLAAGFKLTWKAERFVEVIFHKFFKYRESVVVLEEIQVRRSMVRFGSLYSLIFKPSLGA